MLEHSNDSDEPQTTQLIDKLKRPLWSYKLNDAREVLIAITVNPPPTKLMNKRPYSRYTQEQQQQILSRIESKIRKDNQSIVLEKIYYEVCPILKQMHFHAMYKMPMNFLSTIESYYHRIMFDKTATKVWRFLHTEEIYNKEGWITYISKDHQK